MKKHRSTILLILVFVVGLSLLLYPTISDWWNSRHQSRAIESYSTAVADLNEDAYREIWDRAVDYNAALARQGIRWVLSEEEQAEYNAQLNVNGTGAMGYIEIPALEVLLPIYHGTSDGVLQTAVGHIDGSSLPVGGAGSHCVLSGHRGLPSARLFTDLDRLVEGDCFQLHVLDETLTYEVDQIRIVLPSELDELEIVEGEDLCTLVTCTPYGVNTHRLLVRGHRVENARADAVVSSDAVRVDNLLVASVVAAILLLVLLVWLLVSSRRRAAREKKTSLKEQGRRTKE